MGSQLLSPVFISDSEPCTSISVWGCSTQCSLLGKMKFETPEIVKGKTIKTVVFIVQVISDVTIYLGQNARTEKSHHRLD